MGGTTLKICMLGLGALIGGSSAAAQCINLPQSSLKVYTLTARSQVEGHGGPAQHRPDPPAPLGTAHPELLIITFVTGHVTIEKTVVERNGVFCASPKEVFIGMGPVRRTIRLPRGSDLDTCAFEALVEHAERHALAEDKAIDRFVASTESLFGGLLAALKRQSAASDTAAYDAFSTSVHVMLDGAIEELDRARRAASERVDTADELAALGRKCGGSLHGVVKGAGAT